MIDDDFEIFPKSKIFLLIIFWRLKIIHGSEQDQLSNTNDVMILAWKKTKKKIQNN